MPKTKSLRAGTLDRGTIKALIEKHATGKFGGSSTRRVAMRWLGSIVDEDLKDRDILYHEGNLTLKDGLSTAGSKKPWTSILIVDGDLEVKGLLEDSLDPESVIIVTGSVQATDIITEGFMEVHGDVIAERSILFRDNDACTEIFGNLTAPFIFTKYHSVNVHGVVKATLCTGDSQHIRAKKVSFIEETDRRVKALLSPKLLKVLEEEIFEEDDEEDEDSSWIDFIDDEKLAKFVEKGNDPLATAESKAKPVKKKTAKKKAKKA
jgi:hypothetical protein